jgi:undecaprenyl pyrophosphate phosphatase UppP
MEPNDKEFRRGLLEQMSPEPGRLDRYRKEMTQMLDENERGLRRERRWTVVMWLYGIALMTVFLLVSGFYHPTPERIWMVSLTTMAMVLFCGGLELVKHFINRSRVEVLKELKQIELRVLELNERLRSHG